ncbi:MarR family transcriptional regulator [Kribbella sp. NBC_01245]|uniref:MarR family winged helix-turn-helix transcriptional regulator n=1 Tax=Kribbella sp. NBC_01245 TaxID=2903578 RepID=UPI002E2B95A8|nr:MarR family transcriptional regulator [Kribbella sp. NBC_01245]
MSSPIAEVPTSVEEDLGWALGVVFRRYAKAAGESLADVPGGPRGYQVLATANREGPRRQLELAGHLGVDRTVMTYLLDDLEKAGLVERQPDSTDRRARLIVLSDKGREVLCDLEKRLTTAERQVLDSLDEGERLMFRTLLQRVAVRAEASGHNADACTLAEELDENC